MAHICPWAILWHQLTTSSSCMQQHFFGALGLSAAMLCVEQAYNAPSLPYLNQYIPYVPNEDPNMSLKPVNTQ